MTKQELMTVLGERNKVHCPLLGREAGAHW